MNKLFFALLSFNCLFLSATKKNSKTNIRKSNKKSILDIRKSNRREILQKEILLLEENLEKAKTKNKNSDYVEVLEDSINELKKSL